MNKFKVGDRVKRLRGKCQSAIENKIYKVVINDSGSLAIGEPRGDLCECQHEWTLVENNILNNKTNMTTLEKFSLVFKKEPEKSFVKAGITNSDDLLTDDGQKIFLSWLLKKHGDEFNKEVVSELIKGYNKE